MTTLHRRNFFRRAIAGGAAFVFLGTPWWEAAAQLVEGTAYSECAWRGP